MTNSIKSSSNFHEKPKACSAGKLQAVLAEDSPLPTSPPPTQIILLRVSEEQIRCNICEDPGVFVP